MKIVFTTPLYPPDIGVQALYVKEIASRLSHDHTITILTYGLLPEKIENVQIIGVPKNIPLLKRLLLYTRALSKILKDADIVLSQNGPSVELPILLCSFFSHIPIIFHIGDQGADTHAKRTFFLGMVQTMVQWRAKETITDIPLPKPEQYPFKETPVIEEQNYVSSWEKHIQIIESILKKYVRT